MRIFLTCVVLSGFLTGCFPDTYGGLKKYKEHMSLADEAVKGRDYEGAIRHGRSAALAANEIGWPDGEISAKIQLAGIYMAARQDNLAEHEYQSTIKLCITHGCDRLGDIYQSYITFFLYAKRDPDAADRVLVEMTNRSSYFDDERTFLDMVEQNRVRIQNARLDMKTR